jgi:hypothetical protein
MAERAGEDCVAAAGLLCVSSPPGKDGPEERIELEVNIGSKKQMADDTRIALTDRATTTRVCRRRCRTLHTREETATGDSDGMERGRARARRATARTGEGESDLLFHRSLLHP